MLQYRLFAEVSDDRGMVEKKAEEQLHSWLRRKRLAADALRLGRTVDLGARATGSLAVSQRPDGSRSWRAIIAEDNNKGRWTTRLTIDIPGNDKRKPWLWLDLDGPDDIVAKAPGLASMLLEVFDAKSDGVRQGAAEPISRREDVRELVESVCSETRRGLLFVAGSDANLPFDQWLAWVRGAVAQSVGLAACYVLDPTATDVFNNAIGPTHRVDPWTLRTFQPGVVPDDPEDGRRHKVLGRDRIINDPVRRITRMLGQRARRSALDTPLPSVASRIDRVFDHQINLDLLEPVSRPAERVEVEIATVPPVIVDPVLAALSEVLGGGEPTASRVLELGQLADLGRGAQANRAALSARLAGYEDEVGSLTSGNAELREQLLDTQLDYLDAEEGRAAAEAEVRRLRKLLSINWPAGQVGPDDHDTTEFRPSDLLELIPHLDDLACVDFTGNPDTLQELSRHDETGAWAGKAWDAMNVLNEYATAIATGAFEGNVRAYLENIPPGGHSWPVTKYADHESKQTRSNDKFRGERTFPVPTDVCAGGVIFMEAHFKLAKFRTISPRLYFHNDVRGTGKVFVGYIGKHPSNTLTN
ncbi:hypothetical protein [Actinokineospora pegani]|uniref:hypothetical protein n=1 Tax=Actinokineospora pegani TaxID=2654637 RepID=UPI0012EAAE0D|nr:hypothetical protein [Actinokineospora pegani]